MGVAAADADAVFMASDGALVGVAEGVLLLLLQADATIARTASSEAHRFISTPFRSDPLHRHWTESVAGWACRKRLLHGPTRSTGWW